MKPTAAFLTAMLFCTPMLAAAARGDEPPPRLITVQGQGEVRVTPDEAVLVVGVETLNKDIHKAKEEHDRRVKEVFAVAKAQGLEERQIQTDRIHLEARYHHRSDRSPEFMGYQVRQTIALTLRDLQKFEALLTDLLLAGVNEIQSIEFRTTKLREHKDEARLLGLRAAKEKALALAQELGVGVGRPYAIIEGESTIPPPISPWSRGNWIESNMAMEAGGPGGASDTIAPGEIVIRSSVTVSFELE